MNRKIILSLTGAIILIGGAKVVQAGPQRAQPMAQIGPQMIAKQQNHNPCEQTPVSARPLYCFVREVELDTDGDADRDSNGVLDEPQLPDDTSSDDRPEIAIDPGAITLTCESIAISHYHRCVDAGGPIRICKKKLLIQLDQCADED